MLRGTQPMNERRQRAIDLAHEGLWVAEIARRVNMTPPGVTSLLSRFGVKAAKKPPEIRISIPTERAKGPRDQDRVQRMASMYRQGLTLVVIGEEFGLTRERVRQLLKSCGLNRLDGGSSAQSAAKRARRQTSMEARSLLKWGMPLEQARELRRSGVTRAYESQRNSAKARGITFALTLAQWWTIWRASGKWDQRGRGIDHYCMSRIKDAGGYVPGNVWIKLSTENSREAVKQWRGKPRKANRGIFHLYPGRANPFMAKANGRYLGVFPTEDAAVAARAAVLEQKAA